MDIFIAIQNIQRFSILINIYPCLRFPSSTRSRSVEPETGVEDPLPSQAKPALPSLSCGTSLVGPGAANTPPIKIDRIYKYKVSIPRQRTAGLNECRFQKGNHRKLLNSKISSPGGMSATSKNCTLSFWLASAESLYQQPVPLVWITFFWFNHDFFPKVLSLG